VRYVILWDLTNFELERVLLNTLQKSLVRKCLWF